MTAPHKPGKLRSPPLFDITLDNHVTLLNVTTRALHKLTISNLNAYKIGFIIVDAE